MARPGARRLRRLRHLLGSLPGGLAALIVLALALTLLAGGQSQRQGAAREPTRLRIVTALLPPHMDSGGRGREAEVIRAALAAVDPSLEVEFFVLPFSRHWASFLAQPRFDAVTTVPAADPSSVRIEGYASRPYITYRNGIGFRCDRFDARAGAPDLAGLAGHPVAGFAGAAAILPRLASAVPAFAPYREWRNQRNQTARLLDGEVDAVIADGAIVRHYLEAFGARRAPETPLPRTGFAPVFPATAYRMVFRTQAQRDLFDEGLARLGGALLESIDSRYYPPASGGCR